MSESKTSIEVYMNEARPRLMMVAPNESLVDGVIKSAILAIGENDELKKCFDTPTGKMSIYNAMKRASATGLSLNPMEGKSALIAYAGKCQYQIMKNGLVELAMRTGKVSFITADTVRKNDEWQIIKGMNGDEYRFSPARSDRGEIEGFFAALKTTAGETSVFYMTVQEMEEHRDKYSKMYNAKKDASPWSHSFEGMGIKTILKKLLRNTAISPEINIAISSDDEAEAMFAEKKGTSSDDALEKLKEKDVTPEKAEDGGMF